MLRELFLIRHAEPDRSRNVPYNTPPGPPLTLKGEGEAVQAAHWLRGQAIERLVASPFARTRATAETIASLTGLSVTYEQAIREGEPGETHASIRARIGGLLAQLEDTSIERVGLVTHGACVLAVLQITTADRIDLATHRYDYGNPAPTAGIWHGVRGDDGAWAWSLAFRPADEAAVL